MEEAFFNFVNLLMSNETFAVSNESYPLGIYVLFVKQEYIANGEKQVSHLVIITRELINTKQFDEINKMLMEGLEMLRRKFEENDDER